MISAFILILLGLIGIFVYMDWKKDKRERNRLAD